MDNPPFPLLLMIAAVMRQPLYLLNQRILLPCRNQTTNLERAGVRHRPVKGPRQIFTGVDDVVPIQEVVKIELKAAVAIRRIG